MVKKCLIAIAVVAMLASTVQAATNPMKNEGWPFRWKVEYKEMEICKIDVILEVGYYVQIKDCDEVGPLKLKQEACDHPDIDKGDGDFPCYLGCVEFEARANFAAVFAAEFNDNGGIVDEDNTDIKWKDDDDQILGDGVYELLGFCMSAWDVELWKSGDGKTSGTVTVGEITISVKPPLTSIGWTDGPYTGP